MKKLLFFIPFLLFADVDPFKAGNLNSPNPYGLTPDEKAILKNKNEIIKNKKNIKNLQNKIQEIKNILASKLVMYDEIINDLKDKTSSINTIIDEINNLNRKVKNLENNLSSLESNLTSLNTKYDKLKKSINEIVKIQNENFKYLADSIQDILNQIKMQNINPKRVFKKAKKLFFSDKLDEAKKLFLLSLNHHYMPATSSFYLGEIAYKRKNYKEALAYYKKSISLYPKKTSFTDKLLYHTGISFEKLGMKKEAILTFQKLINDFGNSKYANLAKKELEKIK
jgi:TolA-binding protein